MLESVKQDVVSAEECAFVADCLMRKYGRSGSGRASALRLLGAYLIFKQSGLTGLHRYGFSRDSILLYLEKLRDAGLLTRPAGSPPTSSKLG